MTIFIEWWEKKFFWMCLRIAMGEFIILTNTKCRVISVGCVGMRWLSRRRQCAVDFEDIQILTLTRSLHILQFIVSLLGAFYFCWCFREFVVWIIWSVHLILLLLFLCCTNDRCHGRLFCLLNIWRQLSIIDEDTGTRRRNEGEDATAFATVILVTIVTMHWRGYHICNLWIQCTSFHSILISIL